jgi:predicted amidohydrolase
MVALKLFEYDDQLIFGDNFEDQIILYYWDGTTKSVALDKVVLHSTTNFTQHTVNMLMVKTVKLKLSAQQVILSSVRTRASLSCIAKYYGLSDGTMRILITVFDLKDEWKTNAKSRIKQGF